MKGKGILAVVFSVLLAASAWSAQVDVTDVTGSWQNSVPPPPDVTIVNGDPTSTVRWGVPVTPPLQSGYDFTSHVPPTVTTFLPPSPSPWINFGAFTHQNWPIFAPSLQSIDLSLALSMLVDGTTVNGTFVYTFSHNETPNAIPCNPSGGTVCPDVVTVSAPSAGSFSVGGVLYTLELNFSQDGGQTTVNQFITEEGQANTAALYGRFTSEGVPTVPEPGTVLLLTSGLGAIALLRRRMK